MAKLLSNSVEVWEPWMGIHYGLNRVRFTALVPVGSRLLARVTLLGADPIDSGGYQLTWQVTIEREGGGKPACIAESISRRYPDPAYREA